MLDRHLVQCPACRGFGDSVAAFTTELRTAPLVDPPGSMHPGARATHTRRRAPLRLPLVALAATLLGVTATSVVLHGGEPATIPASAPPVIVVDPQAENEPAVLRQLRNVVHARVLESDAKAPSTPGIFLG